MNNVELENRRLLTLLRMYENDVNTLLLSIKQKDKERTGEK